MNHNYNPHKIGCKNSTPMEKFVWKMRRTKNLHFGGVFVTGWETDKEAVQG